MNPYPDITIVVGSGRSGTGYLMNVLFRCMDIGFSEEPKFVARLYHQHYRFGDLRKESNLRKLAAAAHDTFPFRHLREAMGIPSSPDEIVERAQEPTYRGIAYAVFQLIADKRGKTRLGYKDPADLTNLPILAELFPTARFVHIMRDGRDVALSQLKFRWGPTNLYAGCRYWASVTSKGRRDGKRLANRYFELRLEDLMNDTERVATALFQFLNGTEDTSSAQRLVDDVERSKNPGAVSRWRKRLDRNQCYICEAAAGSVLRSCGYETEFDRQVRLSPFKAGYYVTSDQFMRVVNLGLRQLEKI